MMDGTFVKAIAEVVEAKQEIREIGGKTFSTRPMQVVEHDPRPEPLTAVTLTALVDYLTANVDKAMKPDLLLHVQNSVSVALVGPASGSSLKRTVWIRAQLEATNFPFGQRMEPEMFIVALQTLFQANEETLRLQQFASSMTDEQVKTLNDDGVTQIVAVRRGVSLAASVRVPNPVKLRPYRTFREIEQPESLFVFRVSSGSQGAAPLCALIEADGGAWKLTAVASVKAWLKERIPDVAVIG